MENTETLDVKVVSTETDYAELVKNAAITSVVTVLVMAATTGVVQFLANKSTARRNRLATVENIGKTDSTEK